MVVEKAAPVDAFVAMESEAALKLVNMVASALSSAQRVFAGSDLLTAEVKAVTTSLAAGKVPRPWDAKWEGPDSPALWLQVAVLRRVHSTQLAPVCVVSRGALSVCRRRSASCLRTRPNDLLSYAVYVWALRLFGRRW